MQVCPCIGGWANSKWRIANGQIANGVLRASPKADCPLRITHHVSRITYHVSRTTSPHFCPPFPPVLYSSSPRRGRIVGLVRASRNAYPERDRGFESLPLRLMTDGKTEPHDRGVFLLIGMWHRYGAGGVQRDTPGRLSDVNGAEAARGRRHCHLILAGAPAAGYDTGHTGSGAAGSWKLETESWERETGVEASAGRTRH